MRPRFSCLLGRGERTFRRNSSLSSKHTTDTTTKAFLHSETLGLTATTNSTTTATTITSFLSSRDIWVRPERLAERNRVLPKNERKPPWTTAEEMSQRLTRKAELQSQPSDTAEHRAAQLVRAVAYKAGRTTIFKYLELWKMERLDVLTPGDHMEIIHLINFDYLKGRATKLHFYPLIHKVVNLAWQQFLLSGKVPTHEDHRQRIYVLANCRDVNGMCTAWKEMKAAGHVPSYPSYLHLACCFSRSNNPFRTLDVVKAMKANGLEPDCRIYTEVVRMHCVWRDRTGAERLIEGMLRTKRILNKISDGTLELSPGEAKTFEMYGKISTDGEENFRGHMWNPEIVAVVRKFSNDGRYCLPPPNSKTFHPLIRAYRREDDVEAVRSVHNQLKVENIWIHPSTYEHLIRAYAQSCDFTSCLETWHEFSPNSHTPLPSAVYNSIIYAALVPKKGMIPNPDLAEQVLKLFVADHGKLVRPETIRRIEKAKLYAEQLTTKLATDQLRREELEQQRQKYRNEVKELVQKTEANRRRGG